MDSKSKLKDYFNLIKPLGEEENLLIETLFFEKKVKKKYFLLHQGDLCNYNSFVIEGLLKLYHYDENDKEHILQFSHENWWIGDPESFHRQTPSDLYVEAIENSILLQISREDFYNKLMKNDIFNYIFRKLTENAMISLQKRMVSSLKDSAEERYKCFLSTYPKLSNRLTNQLIASYIGVTPQFLSKLRSY